MKKRKDNKSQVNKGKTIMKKKKEEQERKSQALSLLVNSTLESEEADASS